MATHTNNYNNRVALITGGTKGIGLEVARQLAQKGIQVLMGSRNELQGEQVAEKLSAENLPVTYIIIDVTDPASIDLAVTEVANAYGRLDILINNSSIFLKETRPTELSMDMLRKNFEVNLFGAFAVTKAFLSLLRQSSSACVVNISNALGCFYYQNLVKDSTCHLAFSASKSALNMLTLLLAKDLDGSKIKVNACALRLTPADLLNFHPRNHAVEIATRSIVHVATLFDDDGPTGKIFGQDGEEYKW